MELEEMRKKFAVRMLKCQFEGALVDFYEAEDCVTFVSGHACPHNDWEALDKLLRGVRREYRNVLIASKGLCRIGGDFPDLARLVEIKACHEAFLIVDQAHSLGVLGKTGRGTHEYTRVPADSVNIWMGRLGKTLVGCGGYIVGCQLLIDMGHRFAPRFLYSAGMPSAMTTVSLVAGAAVGRTRAGDCAAGKQQTVSRVRAGHQPAHGRQRGLCARADYRRQIAQSGVLSRCAARGRHRCVPDFLSRGRGKNGAPAFSICATHQLQQIEHTLATLERLAR
jgi:8-amino-7-oxononanoate synthase